MDVRVYVCTGCGVGYGKKSSCLTSENNIKIGFREHSEAFNKIKPVQNFIQELCKFDVVETTWSYDAGTSIFGVGCFLVFYLGSTISFIQSLGLSFNSIKLSSVGVERTQV